MSKVKDSELYFLVLHWLKSGPCQAAAEALQQELQQRELLPTAPTIGPRFQADYPSLCRLFEHVPQSALRELIEECVQLHSDDQNLNSSATTPLLETTGSLSFIPSVRTQLTPATLVVPPPSCRPNFFQRLFQRECAYPNRPLRNDQLIDNVAAGIYEQLCHVKTIRGHRKAVYCVTLDSTHDWALTGADDGVIKIWNLKTGLLKMTCRGHSGEITDLKINCNDSRFASCSNDGTTRIWSLEEDTLGHHIQSMTGHQLGVTYIAFSPVLPSALLSVSLDGTCRLWHAEKGIELIRLKPVGRLGHFYNSEAFEKPREHAIQRQKEAQFTTDRVEVDTGLTSCAFSPDGNHFAVSSCSGQCFLWHWDATQYAPGMEREGQTWPDVSLPSELLGHAKCVPVLLFNHQGTALCTASSDGAVKIWRPKRGGKRSASWKGVTWECRWSFALPDPLPCPAYNNRRRRAAPECNQIAWSCDDQYVMAAYSCAVIMVWNAQNGEEENILYGGHADSPVHVLDAHPSDPKLCFSAGYDGMLILWDIVNGRKIITFSSQDTHPGRWHWADPIQFVDGRFRSDGMGIVVSDVAGQFHLYGLNGATGAMRRTPYDQFFLYDYDKVIISDDGEPVDMESGEPQHIHRTRFSMVDITEEPYAPFLQEILVGGGDLALLPSPTNPPSTPASLFVLPPTMSAALWLADEMGLGPQATSTRVTAAQQRQIALMQEEGGYEEVAEYLPPVQIEEPPELPEPEIEEESDGSEYTPDELEPLNSPLATRRSERLQTRTGEPVAAQGRRIPTRQNPQVAEELESMEEDEADFVEILTEEEEELTPPASETTDSEPTPPPSPVRRRRRRTPSPVPPARRRRTTQQTEIPRPRCPLAAQPPPRRSTRLRRLNPVFYETSSSESPQSPTSRFQSARSERAARRAAAAAGASTRSPLPSAPTSTAELEPIEEVEVLETIEQPVEEEPVMQDPSTIYAQGRGVRAYQWLSESRRPTGYYVPQVADNVAFFPRLHRRFCEENPPLATVLDERFANRFRFAEPCRVISVRYEIFREVPDQPTVARVTLKLIDTPQFSEPYLFEVVVPPPFFGHEEFLMSQSFFLNSVTKDWTEGQQCEVFYFDEWAEWWRGEIVEIRHPLEPGDSVWDCEAHYRRYRVNWMDHKDMQAELLSPWDLAAVEVSTRLGLIYEDSLDGATKQKLQQALAEVKELPLAKHFRETLAPNASFVIPGRTRRENKTLFYNQVVPLPISLRLIKARLQHTCYYTSIDAFFHDVQVIVDNAHLFTEPTSAVSQQADELQQYIIQSMELMTESDSGSASSEQELRLPRRRTSVRPAEAENHQRDYQIRTRGMAKREREIEAPPNLANRRRRRYT